MTRAVANCVVSHVSKPVETTLFTIARVPPIVACPRKRLACAGVSAMVVTIVTGALAVGGAASVPPQAASANAGATAPIAFSAAIVSAPVDASSITAMPGRSSPTAIVALKSSMIVTPAASALHAPNDGARKTLRDGGTIVYAQSSRITKNPLVIVG